MKKTLYNAALLLLLAGCSNTKETKQAPDRTADKNKVILTEAQYKNAGIRLGKLEKRTVRAVIKVNGRIDLPPQGLISVSFPLGGYLKSTPLIPGMPVRKGQIIGTMQDPQYIQLQQDYLTTKSKLEYSTKEFLRQKTLNQSKASSDKVFQEAEMDYKSQKIALRSLGEKLRLLHVSPEGLTDENIKGDINIYSPVNGFVSKVNINTGQYVNPADVLFELISPNAALLTLKVFEKDLLRLRKGMLVNTSAGNNPEQKYQAEIILINQNISPDGSTEIRCRLTNPANALPAGTFMNAEIETGKEQDYTLPENAVVSFEDKEYIFTAGPNRHFEMIPVNTGYKDEGYIEILNSGPLQNKQLVTEGAYILLMKLKNASEE